MANNLSLSNVLNVSVAATQPGLGTPNTGNIALFSREAYASTFGTAGYKIYYSPGAVGVDFGTSSNTYAMALALFGQQPNFLNAGGYLVVIPFLTGAQNQQVSVTFPAVPASGSWAIAYNGVATSQITSALTSSETAAQLQTALQLLTGLGSATATGSIAAGFAINSQVSGVGHPFTAYAEFTVTCSSASATIGAVYTDGNSNSFTVAATIASQLSLKVLSGSNTPAASGTLTKVSGTGDATITYSAVAGGLQDSLGNTIFPQLAVTVPGSTAETLDQAIIRTQPLVSYFGVMAAEIASSIVTLAAAAYIQTQNLLGFFVSYTSSDIQAGGMLYQIQQLFYTQSRTLFYDDVLATALAYQAAYASLLLSVNYAGSNTCLTMNLKTLTGVAPDPSITQTLVNTSSTAGADVYVNLAGVPKCLSYGANDFSDNQSNLQAFILNVKVAYFNVLATTNTKIPQTENGMDVIKNAIDQVCAAFVTNGFLAPGTWTSSTVFGPQGALVQNVSQRGYYIFSSPIATQLQSTRAARVAPPIQIAIKYAGAEHTGSAIIFLNP